MSGRLDDAGLDVVLDAAVLVLTVLALSSKVGGDDGEDFSDLSQAGAFAMSVLVGSLAVPDETSGEKVQAAGRDLLRARLAGAS